MQDMNHNQVREEGSDLPCFSFQDFVLNSDRVSSQVDDVNTCTDVADDIRVNPQSQKQHFTRYFLTEDEIFEGLPNIDQAKSNLSYQHLSSEFGTRDVQRDDVVVISKEEFNPRSGKNEVHNQHERNRRNAIKERIHKLGELLPNCTKTDQASILNDAVEHIKFLLCQRQMLSMTWYYMWLAHSAGLQNNMAQQQIPKCIPHMMYAAGDTSLPFSCVPPAISLPTTSPMYPQLRLPATPPSPTTLIAAQVKPMTTAMFDAVDHVRPMPYTINRANQGECSTSQYSARDNRDHNQEEPILSEENTGMTGGTMLSHPGA